MRAPFPASKAAEAASVPAGSTPLIAGSPLQHMKHATYETTSSTGHWQPRRTFATDASRRISVSPRLLACLILLGDALALGLASVCAATATGLLGQPASPHHGALFVAVVLAISLGASRGAYRRETLHEARPQLRALLPAAAAAWVLATLAAIAFDATAALDAAWLSAAALCSLILLACGRIALAGILSGPAGERIASRTVFLGASVGTARLIAHLRNCETYGLRLLGVIEDDVAIAAALKQAGIPCLGTIDEMFWMIRQGEVEQVLLPIGWAVDQQAVPILRNLAKCPVDVCVATEFSLDHHTTPRQTAFYVVQKRPIAGGRAIIKYLADYLLALATLVVVAAPMLLIAFAIRLETRGPIFFRQRRTGFNNQSFLILKFRTMHQDATDFDAQRQVMANDARVTRVGRVLRRTSLDELPQLFNILAGEMSFVGPRPHAPGTRAGGRRFEDIATRYESRHRVKPGLTGLAQVRGLRGSTETEEKLVRRLDCDLEYIRNWSLWLDIAIMFRTLVAVACMRNAH